jgi:glutamine amidotransferase
MTVCIVDYGVCNLGSVKRAYEECGANVLLCDNPDQLEQADHIVLPGVGAFASAMDALVANKWDIALREQAVDKKIPLMGICLGMQLLATTGEEGGNYKGLNFIPGVVKKIVPADPNIRIPHVGWNEAHIATHSPLTNNIPNKTDFYFVHSYHVIPDNNDHILLTTPYGENLTAAIHSDNIFGFQFHPEKSGRSGFQLIKNFLEL